MFLKTLESGLQYMHSNHSAYVTGRHLEVEVLDTLVGPLTLLFLASGQTGSITSPHSHLCYGPSSVCVLASFFSMEE